MDPGSRLFVSLAEEYRKVGRFRQALSALQKGLLAHPGYIAAQVALGRVYVEVNQNTDAIATFTKVLVADPGNLVAAKSLADIHLARGDKLEAVKKYKLYRALSGDRKVDPMIASLEAEVTPRPVTPSRTVPKVEPPPPPPKFQETDKSRRRPSVRPAPQVPSEMSDAFDITSVTFEPGEDSGSSKSEDPFPFIPTRDTALAPAASAAAASRSEAPAPGAPPPPPPSAAAPGPPEGSVAPPPAAPPVSAAATGSGSAPPLFQAPEDVAFGEVPQLFQAAPEPGPAAPAPSKEAPSDEAPSGAAPSGGSLAQPAAPTGRALADLYYSQGHYAEALRIYDDLATRHPFDVELMKMRRDAEARLLPAATASPSATPDPGIERRRARIRALERWLSVVSAG